MSALFAASAVPKKRHGSISTSCAVYNGNLYRKRDFKKYARVNTQIMKGHASTGSKTGLNCVLWKGTHCKVQGLNKNKEFSKKLNEKIYNPEKMQRKALKKKITAKVHNV